MEKNTKINKDKVNVNERKYDFIPLAALRNLNNLIVIKKKDLDDEIYDKNACIFGVDCVALCLDDELKESEILNTVLLFILKSKIEVIHEFMKNKTMPINNHDFSSIDVYCNYGFEFNFDID